MPLKCPFQNTIIAGNNACCHGLSVTVRNTPMVHCQDQPAHSRCEAVASLLKQHGLAAFEMEDDLLTTPHSIYDKIQFGGLLALQQRQGQEGDSIADIDALLAQATDTAGSIEALPYTELTPQMQKHKLRRRRK